MAAIDAGVKLGTGYPGTPSTEILETFEKLGGRAKWLLRLASVSPLPAPALW
jgi:TPP-dependent indolepyruvate ferredoxin oxidoreductase alpha subunit